MPAEQHQHDNSEPDQAAPLRPAEQASPEDAAEGSTALERLRDLYGDDAVQVVLSAGLPGSDAVKALRRYLPPPERT